MIYLEKCPCGSIAHISAEESMYNNYNTPWNAACRCTNCSFEVDTVVEYKTKEIAVDAIAYKWNNHPAVVQHKNLLAQIKRFKGVSNE